MKNVCIILAAGVGKRMHSSLPKVMHPICGRPMVQYVIDAAKGISDKVIVVISEEMDRDGFSDVELVYQKIPLGTGDAAKQALTASDNISDEMPVLIITGDNPLIKSSDLKELLAFYKNTKSSAALLTALSDNPFGFGRIVRDKTNFVKIVEEKDATEEEKKINEINTGIYVFAKKYLVSAINEITPNNLQKEYYLTDALAILKKKGVKVSAKKLERKFPVYGVNNRKELSIATKIIQGEILDKLMFSGVTIINTDTVSIDFDAKIENDVTILPGVLLQGRTTIGKDCVIGPNTRIVNSVIKNNVSVEYSVVRQANVGDNCKIGPFAYVRPDSKMSKNVKIGTFVEVKKSQFGENTKVPHLGYIGDTGVGKNVNIGAGTITCNYDGLQSKKKPTFIEEDVFIGSHNTLVAPVKIGKGAYTAAGSVITEEVPEGALAIGRAKQINKKEWAKRRKKSNG
ncbi:MAG: bifunctional UDP-N-acetylglucosamine diphosphorylase/glucosamine-1-phosphate N-acetyltransferase GlmU [Caldisericota bacterium]|nr:bifunctional UDP-N-acetylglucosamine diphosphorylase/glucosamine-1-phosphate N-acetyltransferase GlmU [Caldisericota bacterium]